MGRSDTTAFCAVRQFHWQPHRRGYAEQEEEPPVALAVRGTREAMADYLGLTLETVSRQISALRREGVIALEGSRRVVIPDFHRLAAESGDDSDGGLPC
mgnify:CR=1 FL=1